MDGILDALISKLQSIEYQSEYSGGKFKHPVISKEHMPLVKTAVTEWYDTYFGQEYGRRIGELEAKVYAYEQIIANSSFAPILQGTRVSEEELDKAYNQALDDLFKVASLNSYDDEVGFSVGMSILDELANGLKKEVKE